MIKNEQVGIVKDGHAIENSLSQENIAIGFVIYHPNEIQVKRIKSTALLGFKVYVFDNSPDYSVENNFKLDTLKYFTCGKNVGLGRGISTICAEAYYDNNNALLFFDQDTSFNDETLNFINNFYREKSELCDSYSAILFNSKSNLKCLKFNHQYFKDVILAINSGSLFFLENLKKMNWHSDNYFVDCVDYEFCLNSLVNGFKIGEFSATPGFDHVSEQDDVPYIVFGQKYLIRAYSKNRIKDTFFSCLKLLYKSLSVWQLRFFINIFKLLTIYISTQLFIRTVGCLFKEGASNE